jgi:hypothetical protein
MKIWIKMYQMAKLSYKKNYILILIENRIRVFHRIYIIILN